MNHKGERIMKLKYLLGLSFIVLAAPLVAEETNVEKMQNKTDDVITDTKKNFRKGKKKVRDATGHHSTKEDIKDKAKDIGDSVEDGATKVKRKID
jgi:hypothetical protein